MEDAASVDDGTAGGEISTPGYLLMDRPEPSRPVAIVTGGGRGIGAAIATSLSGAGYDVVITGRTEDDLVATGRRLGAEWIVADVTTPGGARSVVDHVVDRFGRLDVLVNNAGTAGAGGPLVDSNIDRWWEVMLVNVYGPMAYMRAALGRMVPNEHGVIFNICSYAAVRPTPGNSAYGASKAALARLTDSAALECASVGVTVMSLSPGLVDTEMTRGVPMFEDVPPEEWDPAERIGELVVALLDRSDLHALTGRFVHVRDELDELFAATDAIETDDLFRLTMNGLAGPVA